MTRKTIAIAATLLLSTVACADSTFDNATAESLDEVLSRNPNDREALADVARLNAREDIRLGMLITVTLDHENSVTFFESEPGMLGVRANGNEATDIVTDAIGLEDFSFSGLHERLRPGQAVPAPLLAAEARAADIVGTDEETSAFSDNLVSERIEGPQIDDGIGQTRSGLTATQFQNGGGCPLGGDYNWCLLYWRNGAYAQSYTHLAYFKVAPYYGTVRFRLLVNNVAQADYIMPHSENYVHGWWWDMGNKTVCQNVAIPYPPFVRRQCRSVKRRATMRGEVIWASGDTFHYGGRFHHH